ncbi:uncharacterized protein LOC110725466 [Chenopodium quinoa]|uniref:uncharacterized protein LOC110725466 n=1 Tax=Chenopodium quinoa TaxID=63459 RepID=UPI000B77D3C2|nr:uncharacterized protein LOC110725466 [Chenopodium quinoa]
MSMEEMLEKAKKKWKQTSIAPASSTAAEVVLDAKPIDFRVSEKKPKKKPAEKVSNARSASSSKDKQIKEEEYEVRVPASFLSGEPNAASLWPTTEKIFFTGSAKRLSHFKPPEIVGEAINLQLNVRALSFLPISC